MRYLLRVVVPDRPGALGGVASLLGEAGVDIVTLDVIDRSGGVAIDDVRVETEMGVRRLRAVFEQVPGVSVEAVDEVGVPVDADTPTGLAAAIAECADGAVQCLVDGLPRALGGVWSAAVSDGPSGLDVLAAGAGAPAIPAGVRLPCLPLAGVRRLPPAKWMPAEWAAGGGPVEIGVAPLGAPYSAVLLARRAPRFRATELRRLHDLARVAVAARDRTAALAAAP